MANATIIEKDNPAPVVTVVSNTVTQNVTPASTNVNDGLILIIIRGNYSSTEVWTDPAGWTLIGDAHASSLRVRVYARVATTADLSGPNIVIGTPPDTTGTKVACFLWGFRGNAWAAVTGGTGMIADITIQVDPNASASHTMPSIVTPGGDSNDISFEFVADRDNPCSTGFTWPGGTAYVLNANGQHYGTGGGSVAGAGAYNLTAIASGASVGGDIVTGQNTNGDAVICTIVLRAMGAVTLVAKYQPTIKYNVRQAIVASRTIKYNVPASTTAVSIGRTLVYKVLKAVPVTRTVVYQVVALFGTCVIQDYASVTDGNILQKYIVTQQDAANVTDAEPDQLSIQVSKTISYDTLYGYEVDANLVWNVDNMSVEVTVGLAWNVSPEITIWTPVPDEVPATVWTEVS